MSTVSIITATFNSQETLQGVIDCLEQQIYSSFEWVVVDGRSVDLTVPIIKNNFKGDLRLVSETDEGIYDALNKGLQLATGDIVGLLHSDDFFASPNTLEQIVQQFQTTQADGVFGDLEYVSADNPRKVIRYWKSRPFTPALIKKGWMPAHPTLFLKKEVYQKHGGFDTSLKIAADYDYMLRVLQDPELTFAYLPEVITRMRVGGASNTFSNLPTKMREDLKAMRKNGVQYPYWVLAQKNLSKLGQFFTKQKTTLTHE